MQSSFEGLFKNNMTKQDIFKIIYEELKSLGISNLHYGNISIYKDTIFKDGETVSEEELSYIEYASLLLEIDSRKAQIHATSIIAKVKNCDLEELQIVIKKCFDKISESKHFDELERMLVLLPLMTRVEKLKSENKWNLE